LVALNTTPGANDADSYASLEQASEYATARGLTFPIDGDAATAAEQALRRGTAAVDAVYGSRFPGRPATATQALEWPRTGACFRGEELPDDEIPRQIVNASIEASVRELAEPGSMNPDQERRIKTLIAGPVEIDYELGAPVETNFSVIEGILAPLIGKKPGNTVTGMVARA
jgi:hypothetical protein